MSNDTTVIITAAGFGKRLGYNIPKSLVVINGKTIPRFKYISSFNNKLPEFVEPSDRKPK